MIVAFFRRLFKVDKESEIEELLSYENTQKEKLARIVEQNIAENTPPKTKEKPKPDWITPEALEFLKYIEGFSNVAYQDGGGVWTFGYGATTNVKEGDTITELEAEGRMLKYLSKSADKLDELITVELSKNQFSALLLFVYNIGISAFANSTMLRKINTKDFIGAANEFDRWVYDNGNKIPGLVRRRKAEKAMFKGEDHTIYMTK